MRPSRTRLALAVAVLAAGCDDGGPGVAPLPQDTSTAGQSTPAKDGLRTNADTLDSNAKARPD
jgi:hypothetical protein